MTSQLEPIEFADRSIRDADRDLAWNVVPNEVDCEGATPQDSLNCAVARAVDRILGNMGKPCKAVVGKSVVLIYYADEGVRYMLDANSRALIDHFDKWGSFPPKARIKLLAPRGTKRLGHRVSRSALSRRRGPHEASNPDYVYRPPTRHVQLPRGRA